MIKNKIWPFKKLKDFICILFEPFLTVLAQSAGKVSNASGLVLETFQGILQSLDEPIFRKSHLEFTKMNTAIFEPNVTHSLIGTVETLLVRITDWQSGRQLVQSDDMLKEAMKSFMFSVISGVQMLK